MSNQPVTDVILQTAAGFYRFPLAAGTIPMVTGDSIYVTTADGQTFTFPRATLDPAMYMPMTSELTSTAQSEIVGPDGVAVWTAMAGGTVSVRRVKIQWQGNPGDAVPVVTGLSNEVLPGYFAEANRVVSP